MRPVPECGSHLKFDARGAGYRAAVGGDGGARTAPRRAGLPAGAERARNVALFLEKDGRFVPFRTYKMCTFSGTREGQRKVRVHAFPFELNDANLAAAPAIPWANSPVCANGPHPTIRED